MRLKLGFLIPPNRVGFRHYEKIVYSYIWNKVSTLDYRFSLDKEETEKFLSSFKILELDNMYRPRLTKEEENAIRFMCFSRKGDIPPKNYEYLLESAYQKWIVVFGDNKKAVSNEISRYRMGKVMQYIRKLNNVQITALANTLGVSRITVMRVESGERLPTLDYIHCFARLFDVTIDYLIRLASEY